jgi:hypothetical protein
MKDNSLQNIENYKKDSYANNEMDIYMKYVSVINQYLLFGIETIKNKNSEYLKYILIKGLFTISYVFKMLFLFTRNLDLTYYHCQKSYSYYIEFIGQIGDDAMTYLQLNSKDAALFVYKKTIFDINNNYKKDYYENKVEETKNKIVSILIDTYNKLVETELTQLNFEQLQLKNINIINKIHNNIGDFNDKLYKLYYSFSFNCRANATAATAGENIEHSVDCDEENRELLYKKLTYIKQFCDIIISKKNIHDFDNNKCEISNMNECGDNYDDCYKCYIKIIEHFVKKIRKIRHDDTATLDALSSVIITKYFSPDFEEKIKIYNVLKFINWIFFIQ